MNPGRSPVRGGPPSGGAHAGAEGHRLSAAAGTFLLLLGLGQGVAACAVAQVPGPPASTPSPVTYPVPPAGHTRIIHYPDGRAVITRDRHGTDVTVQRTPERLGPHDGWDRPVGSGHRPRDWDTAPDLHGPSDADARQPSRSLRDAYRQRMLDRLEGHP